MASTGVLCVNHADGEAGYAHNSAMQRADQNKIKPIIDEAVTGLLKSATHVPSSMVLADLGCSSGPNALGLVSIAVDAVFNRCAALNGQAPPELSVPLNDLPDNDFNDVAKRLVLLQQGTQSLGRVLTGIVPGSFYKRLFPSNSLHLVVSSNSLHWLSQAPEDLKSNRIPLHDQDESLRRARRNMAIQAYRRQFRKDFTLFLNLRAQELVPRGRMVVSMVGSRGCNRMAPVWDIVTFPLNDMASRGVISREMLDRFYVPMHGPSDVELREIIEDEGSFMLNKIQVHEVEKRVAAPNMAARVMRAVFEPMIVHHFGLSGDVMDEFVRTLEQHLTPGSPQHAALHLDDRVSVSAFLTKRF
ncbi:hypothetical protein U9M48_040461 [Paspalum notatum var. saurae]|uniref:Uncharacterized protein n=1 Tax=Paspalum notatum var. saurae TaxID=547442 RepID=A0AAQ3UQP3_PASNO